MVCVTCCRKKSQSQTFRNHLKGLVSQLMTFADVSQNSLGPLPIDYIVIRYPPQIVQMAFCDLSHTFHKQVTNDSQHVFVILLWRIVYVSPYLEGPSHLKLNGIVFKRTTGQQRLKQYAITSAAKEKQNIIFPVNRERVYIRSICSGPLTGGPSWCMSNLRSGNVPCPYFCNIHVDFKMV